ncbi:hypothetical protein [Salinicoccus roseus]|uniref:Uncharacterized protein n=1 Tax=Salinicoccus roseus TaxID=45670 RepID=A0A265E6L1_9STAP|nr:hypothetical protein [Salinicoccus roseus]OZT77135.1 hypothetical protein CFN03_08650 [Salinicoccus roseus]
MIQKTQYRTCQCESAQKVERQVLVIRGLKKRLSRLVKASIVASKRINRLESENFELTQLMNKVSAENERLKENLKYYQGVGRPDRNWDSRPKAEVSE